jgi:hypothetical protein
MMTVLVVVRCFEWKLRPICWCTFFHWRILVLFENPYSRDVGVRPSALGMAVGRAMILLSVAVAA